MKHKKADELLPLDSYFKNELNSCLEIKNECREIALQHLKNKINLNRTGNKLSVNEKKAANLNSRLSITKELFDILSVEGLKQEDPKRVLSNLFYRATFARGRDESIILFEKAGIEKYTFMSCKDEKECTWCNSQDGVERPITDSPNILISKHCTCESHCRCTLKPIIKF